MIDTDRFRECSDLLAIALNPIEENEKIELDGNKINLIEVLPMVFKYINKIALKHEQKSEEVFLFMVDAIHYFTCVTDEKPQVTYSSPENLELLNSGYKDSEVRKIK